MKTASAIKMSYCALSLVYDNKETDSAHIYIPVFSDPRNYHSSERAIAQHLGFPIRRPGAEFYWLFPAP